MDLHREFLDHIARLRWSIAKEFGPWLGTIMCRHGIGFDVVEVNDQTRMWSRLEPGTPGSAALIVPVTVHPDDPPHDLVAIVRETGRAYSRTGLAVALGEHLLEISEGPLLVTLSPTTWLHSGGEGVCPLDLPAFVDWSLRHPEIALTVPTVREGERLLAALDDARGRLPAISVQAPKVRRAA